MDKYIAPDISKDKDSTPVQPNVAQFPRTKIGSAVRSFNSSWYQKQPLLEYSIAKDKIYCFCCRHFCISFTNAFQTGFSDWKNIATQIQKHFSSSSHQFAL